MMMKQLSSVVLRIALLFLLLSFGFSRQSIGQNKILADQVTYTSGQKGLLNPDPTVENPNNALSDDDSHARLLAYPGLAIGLGSYKGVIELKFDNTHPANTWSYVRLEGDNSLFKALLGGTLGDALGDVLGYVLVGNQEITVDARMGGLPYFRDPVLRVLVPIV